jgi:Glycosyl transferase family 2
VNLARLRRNLDRPLDSRQDSISLAAKIIISMNGDLQHDPEEIPRFIEKIEEGYDLVSGWRYARGDDWLCARFPAVSPTG